jgi:hypothetical protein
VDHERQSGAHRQVDLRLECAPLVLARRVVAEVVEPGLADRAGARVGGGALDRVDVAVSPALRVMGVAADDRHHVIELACGPKRSRDRLVVHPDGR